MATSDSSNSPTGSEDADIEKVPGATSHNSKDRNSEGSTTNIWGWLSNATSKLVDNSWIWEILSILFSIVCLIAIVAVLRVEDGKELSQWRQGRGGISPNAVISFIGILTRSSFMLVVVECISQLKWLHFHKSPRFLIDLQRFDESSRGPWGAAKFILLQRQKALLGCSAAVITVAAILVDPALQLILSFPSRLAVDDNAVSNFQVARVFDPNNYPYTRLNLPSGTVIPYWAPGAVNPQMQSYILDDLYNVASISAPRTSCPGNRCSWTNATTLGVDVFCEDALPNIKTACFTPGNVGANYYPARCSYNVTGRLVSRRAPPLEAQWVDIGRNYSASTLFNSTGRSNTIFQSQINEPAWLATMSAIKIGNGSIGQPPPVRSPLSEATSCRFLLAALTLPNITTVNGSTTGKAIDGRLLYLRNTTWDSAAGKRLYNFSPEPDDLIPNDSNLFTVNEADYQNLGQYLAQMLTTSLLSDGSTIRSIEDIVALNTPGVAQAIFQSSSPFSRTMEAVAHGMTEAMRFSANSTTTRGETLVQKTFIAVNWGWIVLPVTLIMLTLVLLIIVSTISHRMRVVPWKSSGLALLFHDTAGSHPHRSVDLSGIHELNKSAKDMFVGLDIDGKTPKFVYRDPLDK